VLDAPGLGNLIQEYPASTTDAAGRALTIVKASDGKLYIDRESSASTVGSFAGWLQVGN